MCGIGWPPDELVKIGRKWNLKQLEVQKAHCRVCQNKDIEREGRKNRGWEPDACYIVGERQQLRTTVFKHSWLPCCEVIQASFMDCITA